MEEEKDTKAAEAVVDSETLEKSWAETIETLRGLVTDDGPVAEMQKARGKKAPPPADAESDDESSDEESDDEEEDDGPMTKSLAELVASDNEEAAAGLEVSPFLRSLTKSLQVYIDRRFTKLEQLSKAQAHAALQTMEMQKSVRDLVKAIGETPIPSTSVTTLQKGQRFSTAPQPQAAPYDKAVVLRKSVDLLRNGQLTLTQATVIEGRVNKGMPLPENVAHLFAEQPKA